jgi:GNAT superfamily N-acetyltransferase
MSELKITAVQDATELMSFISFPWQVYKDNPYWVPPLISERKEFLDKQHSPFFEHAKGDFFVARRGEKIVGTIAAFTNELFNQFQEMNAGFFGFFEVLDDPEAAQALLSKAMDWCKSAGHDSVIGPAQYSTNDELGLLIDGYNDRPRILMTYNPPRYQAYIESFGFEKAMDLWAYSIDLPDFEKNMPEKLLRVVEKIRTRKNFQIRTINMKKFDEEVEKLKGIYNNSWERNWGFVPFTDSEIDRLAASLKPLLDPNVVFFVELEGKAIGFGLSLPDLNQPLHLAYPTPKGIEALTMAKLAWHWKVRGKVDWLRVFALGVLPEYRGSGVDALMYVETARAAVRRGYKWAEMSWILEDNEMMNRSIQMMGGEIYKTYRMYEKRT